jgi:hypothetical protein
MHIFKDEQESGLSEALSAKSSIVYASLAEKAEPAEITRKKIKSDKALAGIEDTDLYYTQSILVTTSWNKNDDIFDAKEVWLARETPTHKPTNLEHNESIIVGHITSNWPIDDEGSPIETNTAPQDLPEKFHILTGSVIYKGFTDPELHERATQLIEEIEAGEKYVSMECFFKGFDYGLLNKSTGKYHILARNEDTAFLTKHLRAYGGIGEHENYKIGRVLREITFSGKGFVNRPANPESIIFTKDNLKLSKEIASTKKINEKNDDSSQEGVFSNQANLKETIMSVESEITQAEEVTTVTETEVVDTVESTEVVATETVIDTETVEKEEAAKKMVEEMTKKEEEMKKMKAALEAAQAELEVANEALAAYKNKEAEMLKKEKKAKRMAALMNSGVSEELASATVDKFESLEDEAFDSIASLVAASKTVATTEETTKAEETEVKTDDVSLALENVEVEQVPDLAVGGETESETQSTRAALVDFVCIRLGKKLNKGE